MLILQYKTGTEVTLPVSGPTIHFRADSITGVSDGGSMAATTWTNEGTAGGSLSTSGSNITWEESVLNGRPVVSSTGGQDMTMTGGDMVDYASATQNTIYIVLKQIGTAQNNGTFLLGDPANGYGLYLTWNNDILFDSSSNSLGRTSVAQPAGWDDNYHYCEFYRNGSSGTTTEIKVDNVSLTTGTPTQSLGLVLGVTVRLFGGGSGPVVYHTGDIAEFIMYNTALSTGDRASVNSYLATKYGL